MLVRAEKVIPLGSQTFSKSRTQFPDGASPLFLERGRGGRAWDVDGNEYVDLVCGLLSVSLGYCDQDVDAAIRAQMENGINFSLATEREAELAECLVELIPCAESARFGKNGSDATSAAVRLARAYTGRERIAAAGYHGWQDWFVGSTVRNKGVPGAVGELTHCFPFNDIDALKKLLKTHPDGFAAVIMEPVSSMVPDEEYLDAVKDLAHHHGSLLVFDETITGFRIALGGAQAYFGVTPDLACFGKGMANGMPISAVVGRADIMAEMEEIFYSTTFGGETLSLAAAIACIDKVRRKPVIETLWKAGDALAGRAADAIYANGLEGSISLNGLAPWKVLGFRDHPNATAAVIKTFFIREMLAENILINASHNVCYAHDDKDIDATGVAYDRVLERLAGELDRPGLEDRLGCPVIQPVFSVR